MNLLNENTVYEENAFVCCLNYTLKESFCDFCFKKRIRLLKCPGCQFMHYCSRNCEKNDLFCHNFECEKFRKFQDDTFLKECFKDTLLRLYLRVLIKINLIKVQNFQKEIDRFLTSHHNYQDIIIDDQRIHQINNYLQIIKDLMGFNFFENLETNILIKNFGQMLSNKLEIMHDKETTGLAVFLDIFKFSHSCVPNSKKYFDCNKLTITTLGYVGSINQVKISFCNPDLSYCDRKNYLKYNYYIYECDCVKCNSEKMFPALKFSEKVTNDDNLKLSVKIAEKFLNSTTLRATFGEIFILDPKISERNFSKVKIFFQEMKNCLGFTSRDVNAHKIYINNKFEKSLKLLKKNKESEDFQRQCEIITVCIGLVIIHEVAHLLFRWKGHNNTPTNLKEAGEVIEKKIFCGTFHVLLDTEKWETNSKYIGIGIKTLESVNLRHLSHEEYLNKIYNLSLSDYPNAYVLPIFDENPYVQYKQALKVSDEPFEFISHSYNLGPGVYVINKTCGT